MKHLRFSAPQGKRLASKESRQFKQLEKIVRNLSKAEEALTIPEISDLVKTSVPTGTKLVRQLVDNGVVLEQGKKETDNGRRPTVYALNKANFYAVGAEILQKWIHVSVVRLDMETMHEALSRAFRLEDSMDCLEEIVQFIRQTIADSPAQLDQIVGLGVAMAGNVDSRSGQSADYFGDLGLPLRSYLEEQLLLPTIIDNDTRAIGISEQVLGSARGSDNALVVKVSRDLGLTIISDKQIVLGANGFAGNFGHWQSGPNERPCYCGKNGCLRTEVGGDALQVDLQQALMARKQSNCFQLKQMHEYRYHDVLEAVLEEDPLATALVQQQGLRLGKALGNVVSLLNPDLIVIGGEYVMVQDIFLPAIRAGLRDTAQENSLENCEIKPSKLGRYFSSRGAACMVLKKHELIRY